jgi:predicted transposase YdaD
MMRTGKYEYQSEFARHYVAQGRAEGEARGRAEGEAHGEARGEARGVIAVLEARGLAISDAARARILGCTDLATLDRWVRRAVTVGAVDELFD